MPHDQWRINGPKKSFPYCIYADSNGIPFKSTITNDLKIRRDLRKHDEFRQMYIKLGVVSQAKGSAYIELGQTKVICSVFSPREIPNQRNCQREGNLNCEFKFSNFSCSKRKGYQQDDQEKQCSLVMQSSLEPAVFMNEFPNFQIDIYALVLDNGGSALSAAIMGASLSLINANVPMNGIVVAATAAIHDDITMIDPTYYEESQCTTALQDGESLNHGLLVQAMLPQHQQLTELYLVGNVDVNCITVTNGTLNKACAEIYPVLQQCLVNSVMKMIKKKENEAEQE